VIDSFLPSLMPILLQIRLQLMLHLHLQIDPCPNDLTAATAGQALRCGQARSQALDPLIGCCAKGLYRPLTPGLLVLLSAMQVR
jgi:hypothetical protein